MICYAKFSFKYSPALSNHQITVFDFLDVDQAVMDRYLKAESAAKLVVWFSNRFCLGKHLKFARRTTQRRTRARTWRWCTRRRTSRGRGCRSVFSPSSSSGPLTRTSSLRWMSKLIIKRTACISVMQPTKGPGLIENSSDQQNVFLEETVNSESLLSLNSQVIDAMFEHKVKAGETVIRQGDDGDYFYVVEEGVYHALINCDDGSMKKVIGYSDWQFRLTVVTRWCWAEWKLKKVAPDIYRCMVKVILTELLEYICRCLSITGRATLGSWLSYTICQERPPFRSIILSRSSSASFQPPFSSCHALPFVVPVFTSNSISIKTSTLCCVTCPWLWLWFSIGNCCPSNSSSSSGNKWKQMMNIRKQAAGWKSLCHSLGNSWLRIHPSQPPNICQKCGLSWLGVRLFFLYLTSFSLLYKLLKNLSLHHRCLLS